MTGCLAVQYSVRVLLSTAAVHNTIILNLMNIINYVGGATE